MCVFVTQRSEYTHRESVVCDVLTARYVPAQNGNSESLNVECKAENNFVF